MFFSEALHAVHLQYEIITLFKAFLYFGTLFLVLGGLLLHATPAVQLDSQVGSPVRYCPKCGSPTERIGTGKNAFDECTDHKRCRWSDERCINQ